MNVGNEKSPVDRGVVLRAAAPFAFRHSHVQCHRFSVSCRHENRFLFQPCDKVRDGMGEPNSAPWLH
jgi:hypothetical protein